MPKIESIIIDSREPDWIQTMQLNGTPTAVMALDTGDALIATSDAQLLVIERKTPNDLLSSIKDDRLFAQCSKMESLSPWRYLVISGTLQRGPDGKCWPDGRPSGWDYNSIQGALLTVQELGVNVVYCSGDPDYGPCLERLAKRQRSEKVINKSQRLSRVLSAGESVLAELPGIGLERLDAVLGYCGTPAWALVWLTDLSNSSDRIPGINRGTKLKVRRALGLDDPELEFFISSKNGESENE